MRQLFSIVFTAVFISLAPAPTARAEAADWNQWRGPNRDSTTEESLPSTLNQNLEIQWQKPLGPSYSGPIVCDGLLYSTETVDKKTERVTAYNIDDGQQIWTAQWPGSMAVPFFAAANGDWIRATPACDGDSLLVMGIRDVLVCLDAKSGQERWRVDFPKSIGTPLPAFGAVCSPMIDGDSVYLQTGGPTLKVSLADGTVQWNTLAGGTDMMSSGAFSSPVIATIHGVRQLLVQTRTELCGVELESGDVLWRQAIEAFRGMNILTPTVIGNQVFTAAHSGRSQLWDVNHGDDGKWTVTEKWNQKSQGYMSSPVVVADQIYLHAKNQRLIAMSTLDGSVRWTSKPYGKYWSMVCKGEQILSLDSSGELRLIDHATDTLNVIDELKVANDSWAHLAISGNKVIVRDLDSLKVFSFGTSAAPK